MQVMLINTRTYLRRAEMTRLREWTAWAAQIAVASSHLHVLGQRAVKHAKTAQRQVVSALATQHDR